MTRRRKPEGLGSMTLERRAAYIVDNLDDPALNRRLTDELEPGEWVMAVCDALAEARRRGDDALEAGVLDLHSNRKESDA